MPSNETSRFTYVIFIRTTPKKLWSALTDPDFIRQYWFGILVESDFVTGSPWRMSFPDGRVADSGEILLADPPRRLEIRWRNEFRSELKEEGFSHFTAEIEPVGDAVKLSILHEIDRPEAKFITAVSNGWPQILSNLKSLLEIGEVILTR